MRLRRSIATAVATGVLVGMPSLMAAPAQAQTSAAAGVVAVAAVPAQTYQLGDRTLRKGVKGADVKALQKLLGVKQTATFNKKTRRAVKKVERKYDLKPNGIVSAKTLKYIKKWSRAQAAASRSLPKAGSPAASKRYARAFIQQKYGWGTKQMNCLIPMWERESNWKYWVSNPNGKYHGIPQTSSAVWSSYGYTTNQYMNKPEVQIKVGARYIKGRYGNPCKAWNFWLSHHWY